MVLGEEGSLKTLPPFLFIKEKRIFFCFEFVIPKVTLKCQDILVNTCCLFIIRACELYVICLTDGFRFLVSESNQIIQVLTITEIALDRDVFGLALISSLMIAFKTSIATRLAPAKYCLYFQNPV